LDVGARAGGARLSGRSVGDPDVQGSTVVRPWAGPIVALTGQLGVSWLCLQFSAEGGWAAVSATGLVNEERALAASGPWVALSLGAGVRAR